MTRLLPRVGLSRGESFSTGVQMQLITRTARSCLLPVVGNNNCFYWPQSQPAAESCSLHQSGWEAAPARGSSGGSGMCSATESQRAGITVRLCYGAMSPVWLE